MYNNKGDRLLMLTMAKLKFSSPEPSAARRQASSSNLILLQSSDELALDERYTIPQTTTTPLTPTNNSKMAVKPITGMLRRGLVLDLSVAFGTPCALYLSRPACVPPIGLLGRYEEALTFGDGLHM